MTDEQRDKALMTVPQTFMQAVEALKPMMSELSQADRERVIMTVEYMRSLVEAQAVLEQMIEASMSNFTMALSQRDMALRTMTLWQENGVDSAMEAAGVFVSREILQGAPEGAVEIALKRALGFDAGSVDHEALEAFYQALDRLTAGIEEEMASGEAIED
jgi:hypothetical protein